MLMHLSLGVAAKAGGLENCRSRVDLQSLKSHSRAVYADMQIAQSCKSCSREDLAVAYAVQSCGSCGRVRHAVVQIAQSRGLHSRADHAVAQIMRLSMPRSRADRAIARIAQSCKSRSRGAQSCGPAQPRIPRGRVARIARPLTCACPLTHMLPVSLKMPLLPSPSPRPLSSLDELDPLLDLLPDPDPDSFDLPGIMRP